MVDMHCLQNRVDKCDINNGLGLLEDLDSLSMILYNKSNANTMMDVGQADRRITPLSISNITMSEMFSWKVGHPVKIHHKI